ncbi:MAG: hypothetical protein K6F46_07525 [Desulfovibrio sp.]|nr:hypothetical protein [Desulfovibrio sp.]
MRTLPTVICFLCLCLFPFHAVAGERVFLNTDNPRYVNKVSGFSFALPPGQWDAVENDGGREITIHNGSEGDTDVTRVRAFVRGGYATIPLQTLLNEEAKGYRDILKEEVGPAKDWFALTAEDTRGNYVYVKYFLKGDTANVLLIIAPRAQKPSFDMAVSTVTHSFKPGFGRSGR